MVRKEGKCFKHILTSFVHLFRPQCSIYSLLDPRLEIKSTFCRIKASPFRQLTNKKHSQSDLMTHLLATMRCIAVIPTENTTASVWNSSSPQRTPVTAPVASFRTRSVTLFPDKNWQPPPRMDATHGLKIISPTVPLHHTTSKSGCKPHRIKSHIKVEDNHSLGIRIKSLKKPLFCHYHHRNSSRVWHQFPQGVTYRYWTEIRWRDGEEQNKHKRQSSITLQGREPDEPEWSSTTCQDRQQHCKARLVQTGPPATLGWRHPDTLDQSIQTHETAPLPSLWPIASTACENEVTFPICFQGANPKLCVTFCMSTLFV